MIKSEEELKDKLERLDVIFNAPLDSIEGNEALKLAIEIEEYEDVLFHDDFIVTGVINKSHLNPYIQKIMDDIN